MTFQPEIYRRPLAQRVLAVAQTRIEGTWAAYVDAVPGQSHEREEESVLRQGAKLPEEWARMLFPMMKGPYAE